MSLGDGWWGDFEGIVIVLWHYILCGLAFISISASPPTDASARLCFTILILEECWLAVRRLAVLLLSDISLHLHSGSQEAESQGNHSTGCVIRMTNQSIFLVNLWHQITQLLKYGGVDMGYWDRVFVNKEISLGGRKSLAQILTINFPALHFCWISCVVDSFAFHYILPYLSHWSIRRRKGAASSWVSRAVKMLEFCMFFCTNEDTEFHVELIFLCQSVWESSESH